MNKKIKLLAKQAEIDYELRPEIARVPVWIATDDELEQFAKLLLKECAEWIKNTDSDPDIGEDDANAFLVYFGVK